MNRKGKFRCSIPLCSRPCFLLARGKHVKFAFRLPRRASSYHVLFFRSTRSSGIFIFAVVCTPSRDAYGVTCTYVLPSRYTRPCHSVNNEATPADTAEAVESFAKTRIQWQGVLFVEVRSLRGKSSQNLLPFACRVNGATLIAVYT